MRRLFFLSAILFVYLLLSFSVVYAQGSYVCDYCKKGTSYDNLYCEHCGSWTSHPDSPIRHEIDVELQLSYASIDGYSSNPVDLDELEVVNDHKDVTTSYTYYPNTRYQNPIVPFSFVPYNYRGSIINLSFSYSKIDGFRKFSDHNVTWKPTNISFQLNTKFHLKHFLIGGFLNQYDGNEKNHYSNEHPKTLNDWGVSFALCSPKYVVGMRTGMRFISVRLESYFRPGDIPSITNYYTPDSANQYSLNPYIEYMPIPNMFISIAYDGYFINLNKKTSYQIPLLVKAISFKGWWQITASYKIQKTRNIILDYYLADDFAYTGFIKLEKLFRNSSVYIKPKMANRKCQYSDNVYRREILLIELGGTKTVLKRKGLIEACIYYGTGTDNLLSDPEGDLTQFGGSISFKAFF